MPEPLGIDGDVETVSFIPGDAGSDCWEHQHTEQGLRSAAELLRGVHDASRGWRPPDDAQWGIPAMANPEVICHGDPGPWNMVWDGPKAIGLVDWDLAHPAPVVDDVAYALEYFAPFRDDLYAAERHHFPEPPNRRRRVEAFVEAYGLVAASGLVDAVITRQQANINYVRVLADRGVQPQRQWVEEGILETLEERVRRSRAHRELFE